MIDTAHKRFLRWGAWVLEPVPGHNLGYGKNILLEILEGKGVILPKAPKGSGMKKINVDPVATEVDGFVKSLDREDRLMIRVFYLNPYWTVEQRAQRCGMSRRSMYDQVERVHRVYMVWLEAKK